MSKESLKWGSIYWVVAKDPLNDEFPVYSVRWRGDSFDKKIQEEGRYFLTKEEALASIGDIKREYRLQKQREYSAKSYRKNGRKKKRTLRIDKLHKTQIN